MNNEEIIKAQIAEVIELIESGRIQGALIVLKDLQKRLEQK